MVDLFVGGTPEHRLERAKHLYAWFVRARPSLDARILHHGVPSWRWAPYEAFVENVWTPGLVRRRRRPGSILHLPSNLQAYVAAQPQRAPVVVTCHHVVTFGERGYGSPEVHSRAWERRHNQGLRAADVVVTDAEFTRREVVDHLGVPRDRTRVIPLGVDLDRYRPHEVDPDRRKRLGFAPAPVRNLLYVGTEAPRKNLPRLFEAVARVRRHVPVRLVKVGPPRPPHRQELERLAERLGIASDIAWLDDVREEDIPSYYAAADVFVFPTRFEGFGVPVLEAMAAGCPVVTTHVSSVPEVAGDAALYGGPDDVDTLVENILRVLQEPSLRDGMVERGLGRAATLSWQETARRHVALYEELARSF